jgi:hypothetical protein
MTFISTTESMPPHLLFPHFSFETAELNSTTVSRSSTCPPRHLNLPAWPIKVTAHTTAPCSAFCSTSPHLHSPDTKHHRHHSFLFAAGLCPSSRHLLKLSMRIGTSPSPFSLYHGMLQCPGVAVRPCTSELPTAPCPRFTVGQKAAQAMEGELGSPVSSLKKNNSFPVNSGNLSPKPLFFIQILI